MLSSGELYDMRGKMGEGKALSCAECCDLIDECHRLRHLIEELTDFQSTQLHNEQMALLNKILKTMEIK